MRFSLRSIACFIAAGSLISCSQSQPIKQSLPLISAPTSSIPTIIEPDPTVDTGDNLTKASSEPIHFSTKGVGVVLTKRQGAASTIIRTIELMSRACTTSSSKDHFTKLQALYAKADSLSYVLTTVRTPTRYTLNVLPNLIKAGDIDSVANYFPACGTTGMRPFKVSTKWIVFDTACTSDDAMCQLLKQTVDKSLTIK